MWWPNTIKEIRRLRTEHPNLGKEKLYLFLLLFCGDRQLRCPKVRTIGRLIADCPDKMRIVPMRIDRNGKKRPKKAHKDRKPKGFVANAPGHCGSLDTIERLALD